MRLLPIDSDDSMLAFPQPGRRRSARLYEAEKFKSSFLEVKQKVKSLLKEMISKTGASAAAFFICYKEDSLIAKTGKTEGHFQIQKSDELLLFSGQQIKNNGFYFYPVKSNERVIGYLSVQIQSDQCTELVESFVDTYSVLIFHELEIAQKKSKLDAFSEKLQKKKEELEKAQEYNNNLLSITSHDLSSPLNAASGYLDLMNDCFKDDAGQIEQIEYYHKRIRSGIQDAMDMLRQLSDISKIERGVISFDLVKVNFKWIVQEVYDLIESNAIAKRIDYELVTPDKPVYVKADTVKLKRVIHNLIGNALKYTPVEGNVIVELKYNNEQALFRVKDNGVGIPESHYSKIFAPFVKLKPSGEEGSSYGLGLYVASYFTDLMNGEISVESKEGEGSTFTVSLPVADMPAFENRQVG